MHFLAVALAGDLSTVPPKDDPDFRYGTLKNGFTYYIRKSSKPEKRVCIRLIVKTGYLNERPEESQVSHVIEHLGFQKTAHFPNVLSFLGEQGLIFGEDVTATTGHRVTSYSLSLPSEDGDKLRACMQLVRDWCDNMVFDSAAIEAERGNVLNEIGLPSGDITERESRSNLLLGNPRFEFSYHAAVQSIKSFKARVLIDYYKEWYKPNLQAVIVVGDIDVDAITAMVRKKFDDLKGYKKDAWSDIPKVRSITNGRFIRENSWFRREVVFDAYYKHRSFTVKKDNDQKKALIIELYNSMMNDRLAAIQCPDIIAAVSRFQRGAIQPDAGVDALMNTVVLRYTGAGENGVKRGIKCFLQEQARLARFGFTDYEFKRAKESIRANFEHSALSAAALVDLYERNYLGEGPGPDDEHLFNKTRRILDTVTRDDVLRALNDWQDGIDPDIVIQTSQDLTDVSLSEKSIRQLFDDVRKEKISSVQDNIKTEPVLSKSLVDSIQSLSVIYGVTDYEGFGTTVVNFQNGVQLILKPVGRCNGCKSGQILVNGFKPKKLDASEPCEYYSAMYAGESVLPAKMKREDLRDFEVRQGLVVKPYMSDREIGFRCHADSSDARRLIEMIYAFFRYPRMDSSHFLDFRSSLMERQVLRGSGYDSFLLAQKVVMPAISRVTDLACVTPMRSFACFKDSFSNAYGFRFVITGDFNTDSVISIFDNYLGSLPTEINEPWPVADATMGMRSCRSYESTIYEPGGSKRLGFDFFLGDELKGNRSGADVAVFARVLNMILFRKLREEMGVTYSVGAGNDMMYGNASRVWISFTTVNENLDAIKAAVYSELENLKEKGPGLTDLQMAINLERTAMEKNFAQPDFWQRYMHDQSMIDAALDEVQAWYTDLGKVTTESVRSVAVLFLGCHTFSKLTFNDGTNN